MILTFVLIAGSLAAAAALLLLLPLLRRRADALPPSAIAAVTVLLVVLLGAAGLYAAFSKYTWTSPESVGDTPAAMTARLAKRLAKGNGTADEWLTLGRSYTVLQQYPLAMRAFQRVDQMTGGKNAEALMNMGEVLVQQDMAELRGRAGHLFERALQLDPTSRKAKFYAGFGALGRGETALARQRFNEMLADEPDPDTRSILEHGIQAADQQDARRAGGAEAPAVAGGEGAKIAVHVSLAPALAAKVPADASLFVAARDPKSPGPPFAVKRLAASFPVDVELTEADAMMATRRIAVGQQLEVVARVALGGTPTATSGDPFGQVSYHVGKDGKLNIVIDRLAP